MAQKPDGKASKTERVVFTRPAAERISKAVRIVESGDRDATGLRFGKPGDSSAQGKLIRAATFTGSWAIGASKTVTFKYAPTATQTVTNLAWPISHNHVSPENCIVGKEGTSWWLVVPVLQTATQTIATGISLSKTTISYVTDVSATLNTSNCVITVSKSSGSAEVVTNATVTTATATFLRLRVP